MTNSNPAPKLEITKTGRELSIGAMVFLVQTVMFTAVLGFGIWTVIGGGAAALMLSASGLLSLVNYFRATSERQA